MARPGPKLEFLDVVDLTLLVLAKLHRKKLDENAAADSRQFYEAFFTANDEEVLLSERDPRRVFRQDTVNRALQHHVARGTRLLDVGCGLGDNLLGIEPHWMLTGVEYSERTAHVARAKLADRAEIIVGSAMQLPFASGSLSAISCLEVLEHLPDDRQALREISRVLAPTGVLVASVPYRYWFRQYLPLMGHYRHYTRASFTSLLNEIGFRVIEYLPNCPEWSRAMNYAYIACRVLALCNRVIGRRLSPLAVTLPWSDTPLIATFARWLHPRLMEETRLGYGTLDSSTFVVAAKA